MHGAGLPSSADTGTLAFSAISFRRVRSFSFSVPMGIKYLSATSQARIPESTSPRIKGQFHFAAFFPGGFRITASMRPVYHW